jgi:RHS repeat-associated protein
MVSSSLQMGCTKLDILGKNRSPLQVVHSVKKEPENRALNYYPFGLEWETATQEVRKYRNAYNDKERISFTKYLDIGARNYLKTANVFDGPDPLSDKMSPWSPFSAFFNNPLRFIDPTGLAPETIFKDQNGNVLHETQDGVDATVIVSNQNVAAFNEALPASGVLIDRGAEEQQTISLFNSFAAEGQAMSTTSRQDGSQKIIDISGAAESTTHQIGATAVGAGPVGLSVSAGIAFDSKGNVGLYGSVGFSHGADASLGIEYIQSTSTRSGFNIGSLEGTSVNYSGALGIMDASYGGDVRGNGNYGQRAGSTYSSVSAGFSLGMPVGGVRTIESTKVKVLNR